MLLGINELKAAKEHTEVGDFILMLDPAPLDYLDEIVEFTAFGANTRMWDERYMEVLKSTFSFKSVINDLENGHLSFAIVLKPTDFDIIGAFR